MSARCSICTSGDREAIERQIEAARAGTESWREIARRTGRRVETLRNHADKHMGGGPVLDRGWSEMVDSTVASVAEMFESMPPDVKPLLLLVIHNLRSLAHTRPSQSNMIMALKTIEEMTGLKVQNKVLLEFARAAFGGAVDREVIDADVVDERPQLDA